MAGHGTHFRNYPIDAGGNLFRALTSRTPVVENHPVGRAGMDLFRRQSFVLAVAPFDEIGIHDRVRRQSCELAGAAGALERTGQHERESFARKHRREQAGDAFSVICERQIGRARMLAAQAPHSLAMPDKTH